MRHDPELSKIYREDPAGKEILDTAIKLEGTIRQVGTHACAVIISRDPLVEHTALQYAAGGEEGIVTQYSMKPCEELGLLKMDFLGLKNLSILETTLGILKRTHPDVRLKLSELPTTDKKTYDLLKQGDTTGVFQLESAGMKRYLRELKPTQFADLIAMVSLYRPGPMQFISEYVNGKHGKKKVTYHHESLKNILEETYGIAIYQEQILEIARVFAGFTLGEADLLRRAIGKKIASELAAQREKFIQGAVKQSHNEKLAQKIFDEVIEPFAGYGFNKSHAACYALIAFQTAFLKANYPAEFMAALLTSDADNTDRIVIEISECRNMGISVLPPDVNESRAHFTVVDDKRIRFGLMAIKGIGEGAVREIIRVREKEGRFTNLENVARRVPAKSLNKKTIESLAYSGALDSLGERTEIAANYDELTSYSKNIQASAAEGQTDIFGMMKDEDMQTLKLRKTNPADLNQRFRWEKEYLGLYVSGHPLQGLKRSFQSKGQLIGSLGEKFVHKKVKLTGLVTQMKRVLTKSGKYMAMGEIEDPTARVQFVLFPQAYEKLGLLLEEDKVLSIEGKLDRRADQYQIVIDALKVLSLESMIASAKESGIFDEDERIVGVPILRAKEHEDEIGPYIIKLDQKADLEVLKKLKPFLEEHKGETPVEIHIPSGKTLKRVKVPFGVQVDEELKAELKNLLV